MKRSEVPVNSRFRYIGNDGIPGNNVYLAMPRIDRYFYSSNLALQRIGGRFMDWNYIPDQKVLLVIEEIMDYSVDVSIPEERANLVKDIRIVGATFTRAPEAQPAEPAKVIILQPESKKLTDDTEIRASLLEWD
jgi:hypothetical protein